MKANATREKDDLNHTTRPVSEMADAARKNYEQALRTGLKLQEEAGKWWSSMLQQTTLAQDWQKRVNNATGMAANFMPLAQRRLEEVMNLMEQNSHTSTELIKKAVDAAQTPALAESQAKWMDFWTCSLGVARSNAEAVSQISSKAIDSWIEFVRKSSDAAEAHAA
jgi:hypothetical protein